MEDKIEIFCYNSDNENYVKKNFGYSMLSEIELYDGLMFKMGVEWYGRGN